MSHFAVAVISDGTKTTEELLAPYQKNNMGDCPKEFLEFKFLRRDFHSDYDAAAMLEGWEESKGARLEHDICEAIGMPCKPWWEYLNGL